MRDDILGMILLLSFFVPFFAIISIAILVKFLNSPRHNFTNEEGIDFRIWQFFQSYSKDKQKLIMFALTITSPIWGPILVPIAMIIFVIFGLIFMIFPILSFLKEHICICDVCYRVCCTNSNENPLPEEP